MKSRLARNWNIAALVVGSVVATGSIVFVGAVYGVYLS